MLDSYFVMQFSMNYLKVNFFFKKVNFIYIYYLTNFWHLYILETYIINAY